MLRQQLRYIFAVFKPKRPLVVKLCVGLGLLPTLAGVALGTYGVLMLVWTYAYSPFDLSGVTALDPILNLIGIGLIWGFALLGWWLLLRLARGHADAALWWAVLVVVSSALAFALRPGSFTLPRDVVGPLAVTALYVAAFFAIRQRQRAASQPSK